MTTSSFNLGRYARLALLLLMLAAQGIAVAHDLGDRHTLHSDTCATCILGHGLGTAVTSGCDVPGLETCQPALATYSNTSISTSPTHCHFARAPPVFSWNTQNPN